MCILYTEYISLQSQLAEKPLHGHHPTVPWATAPPGEEVVLFDHQTFSPLMVKLCFTNRRHSAAPPTIWPRNLRMTFWKWSMKAYTKTVHFSQDSEQWYYNNSIWLVNKPAFCGQIPHRNMVAFPIDVCFWMQNPLFFQHGHATRPLNPRKKETTNSLEDGCNFNKSPYWPNWISHTLVSPPLWSWQCRVWKHGQLEWSWEGKFIWWPHPPRLVRKWSHSSCKD